MDGSEMSEPVGKRRSSILKPHKSPVEYSDEVFEPQEQVTRDTRRVSFAETAAVKEFETIVSASESESSKDTMLSGRISALFTGTIQNDCLVGNGGGDPATSSLPKRAPLQPIEVPGGSSKAWTQRAFEKTQIFGDEDMAMTFAEENRMDHSDLEMTNVLQNIIVQGKPGDKSGRLEDVKMDTEVTEDVKVVEVQDSALRDLLVKQLYAMDFMPMREEPVKVAATENSKLVSQADTAQPTSNFSTSESVQITTDQPLSINTETETQSRSVEMSRAGNESIDKSVAGFVNAAVDSFLLDNKTPRSNDGDSNDTSSSNRLDRLTEKNTEVQQFLNMDTVTTEGSPGNYSVEDSAVSDLKVVNEVTTREAVEGEMIEYETMNLVDEEPSVVCSPVCGEKENESPVDTGKFEKVPDSRNASAVIEASRREMEVELEDDTASIKSAELELEILQMLEMADEVERVFAGLNERSGTMEELEELERLQENIDAIQATDDEKCTVLNRILKDTEDFRQRLKCLEEEVDNVKKELGELEESEKWRRGQLNNLNIREMEEERNHEWVLEEATTKKFVASFMWGTFRLEITLGAVVKTDLKLRRVTDLKLIENEHSVNTLDHICKLVHGLVWESVQRRLPHWKCPTMRELPAVLSEISSLVGRARILAKDIRNHAAFEQIKIKDREITAEFISDVHLVQFTVTFTVSPDRIGDFMPVTVKILLGKMPCEKILDAVADVEEGPMYLSRVIERIHEFLTKG